MSFNSGHLPLTNDLLLADLENEVTQLGLELRLSHDGCQTMAEEKGGTSDRASRLNFLLLPPHLIVFHIVGHLERVNPLISNLQQALFSI